MTVYVAVGSMAVGRDDAGAVVESLHFYPQVGGKEGDTGKGVGF